jgi:hypothetical protein
LVDALAAKQNGNVTMVGYRWRLAPAHEEVLREDRMALKWQETLVQREAASVKLVFVFKPDKFNGAKITRPFQTESHAKKYFANNFGESSDVHSAAIMRFKGAKPLERMRDSDVWDIASQSFKRASDLRL